ncbi:hypothetical protein NMY22_g18445 [Coprinellus aureogranulatus]|nr:hypothetical protein NMY22_g18445 [Coprinellus aureogranulatus]
MNQELEGFLRIFCNQRQTNWAEWLSCTEFALNNKISSATGLSPFFINFGKHPACPLAPTHASDGRVPTVDEFASHMTNLCKEVAASLDLAAEARKRSYNKHRRAIDTHHSKKLSDKRVGPFPIVEVISPRLYCIGLPASYRHSRVFNIDRLVCFRKPSFPGQADTTNDFEVVPLTALVPPAVTEVHDHLLTHGSLQLLVSLDSSSDPSDCVWEDIGNLSNPEGIVLAFCTENQLPHENLT